MLGSEKQASTTYLFDRQRSGRLLFSKGELTKPFKVWSARLPNNPPCSPESTAVFDEKGNMYFGCHDGNFYSLNPSGRLRWLYETNLKIYSSPLILPNASICFASGDGILYCLNTVGDLLWKLNVGQPVTNWFDKKLQSYHKKNSPSLHEVNRITSANVWASPNFLSNGAICISGYCHGLSAVEYKTGKLKWRLDLGYPASHLTGVAIADDETIYAVSQQGKLLKVSSRGTIIWKRSLKRGFNAWGNPSIDQEHEIVYVPVSRRENSAVVYAFTFQGELLWKSRLSEGTRGAIGISRENYVLCCGFRGGVYFLNKLNGLMLKKIDLTCGKLWTSCSIDPDGYIFISVIDSSEEGTGRVCCYDKYGNFVWEYEIGKGHSVPVLDAQGKMYVGSWTGEYFCFQT